MRGFSRNIRESKSCSKRSQTGLTRFDSLDAKIAEQANRALREISKANEAAKAKQEAFVAKPAVAYKKEKEEGADIVGGEAWSNITKRQEFQAYLRKHPEFQNYVVEDGGLIYLATYTQKDGLSLGDSRVLSDLKGDYNLSKDAVRAIAEEVGYNGYSKPRTIGQRIVEAIQNLRKQGLQRSGNQLLSDRDVQRAPSDGQTPGRQSEHDGGGILGRSTENRQRRTPKELADELLNKFKPVDKNTILESYVEEAIAENRLSGDEAEDLYDYLRKKGIEVRRSPSYSRKAVFSSEEDSDGENLSEQQAKYFKDSKFRDADGNLLRLYHGSDSAGFVAFNNLKTGIVYVVFDPSQIRAFNMLLPTEDFDVFYCRKAIKE